MRRTSMSRARIKKVVVFAAFCIPLIAAALASCSSASDLPTVDSNSNWLKACDSASDCGALFDCVCRVCTSTCKAARDCTDYNTHASCENANETAMANGCPKPGSKTSPKVCVLPCKQSGTCSIAKNTELSCYAGLCVDDANISVWKRLVEKDAMATSDAADSSFADASPPSNIDASATDSTVSDAEPKSIDGSLASDGGLTSDSGAFPNPCIAPGNCRPVGPWSGYNVCNPAPAKATRPACKTDGTCTSGVCHIDGTCIEPGQCDENGVTTLAISDGPVVKIAVDDTHVYWADNGTEDYLGNNQRNGKIMRVSIQGGSSQVIKSDVDRPLELLVDSTHVYWSGPPTEKSLAVWRAKKDLSQAPNLMVEDTSLRSDWGFSLTQDTSSLYSIAYTTQSDANIVRIDMLPKVDSTRPIELYNGDTRQIINGDQYVYTADYSQQTFLGIPKVPGTAVIKSGCGLDTPGIPLAVYNDGVLYWNDSDGLRCAVRSCNINTHDARVIYQTTADFQYVINMKYYDRNVYILWEDQNPNAGIPDAGAKIKMQIVAAPSLPTESPDSTKIKAEFSIEQSSYPRTPDLDVSASGLFWVNSYIGSMARNRIMRRVHQQ
jgi:hypothetical protein